MMNIKKTIIAGLFLAVPGIVFANANLTSLKVKSYEKTVYQAAEKQSINNGSPVDKQSFTLKVDNKIIGYFLAGQGFNQKDDSVCFVTWSTQSPNISKIIPTIGYGDWEAETCNATKAVGIISAKDELPIKLAVIYDAQSPNAQATESIIFDVNNGELALDENLTKEIGSKGALTLKDLQAFYKKQ